MQQADASARRPRRRGLLRVPSATVLATGAVGMGFFLATVGVNFSLPLYPASVVLLLAVILGLLSLRFAGWALLFFLAAALPGLAYQLQTPIWVPTVAGAWFIVTLLIARGRQGAALGVALGALAGALMHTGYSALGIPLFLAVALLPVRGAVAGSVLGGLTFLIFYVPFMLAMPAPQAGEDALLLGRLDYPRQGAVQTLNLKEIQNKLSFLYTYEKLSDVSQVDWGVVESNAEALVLRKEELERAGVPEEVSKALGPKFTQGVAVFRGDELDQVVTEAGGTAGLAATLRSYLTERGNLVLRGDELDEALEKLAIAEGGAFQGLRRYFADQWGGFLLLLIPFLPWAVRSLYRPASRSSIGYVSDAAPPLALAGTGLLFFILTQALEGSLQYQSGLQGTGAIAGLVVVPLLLGGMGSAHRIYARRQAMLGELSAALDAELGPAERSLTNALSHKDEVLRRCPAVELVDAERTLEDLQVRLQRIAQEAPRAGIQALQSMLQELQGVQARIPGVERAMDDELRDFLRSSLEHYTATVSNMTRLELAGINPQARDLADITSMEYQPMLEEAEATAKGFRELGQALASTGETIVAAVRENLNPGFTSRMIEEIGAGLVNQGDYQRACETILQELQRIDEATTGPLREISQRISGAARAFARVEEESTSPTLERIGNLELRDRLIRYRAEAQSAAETAAQSQSLGHILTVTEQVDRLAEFIHDALEASWEEFTRLEQDNDLRVPQDYDWGRNPAIRQSVAATLAAMDQSKGEQITIREHLEVMERALSALSQLAEGLETYALRNEFLINLPNIDYILEDRLRTSKRVYAKEVPVNPRYAAQYLVLYQYRHPQEVTWDQSSESLTHL